MAWEAKYGGTCHACGRPITMGADRVKWADDGVHVLHEGCTEKALPAPCPRCFLVHPDGACDYE